MNKCNKVSISSTLYVRFFHTNVLFWQLFKLRFGFGTKIRTKNACVNVDEIDTKCQFHQCFKYSFYVRRSQKRKNTVKSSVSFYAFGICERKSCKKNIDEIEPRCQFHQHFLHAFLPIFWRQKLQSCVKHFRSL